MTKAKKIKTETKPREWDRNFWADEHSWLARAYAANTINPKQGTDTKSQDFWDAVAADYKTLQSKEMKMDEAYPDRTASKLNDKFKKYMQPETTKYLAIKHNTPLNSGENESDYKQWLKDLYYDKHGALFKFENCVEYLEVLPKFSKQKDPENVEEMKEETESGVKTIVPDLEYPEGSKKFVKRQKLEEAITASFEGADGRVQAVVDSINSVKKVMEDKAEFSKVKEKMEYLKDQRQFCIAVGDLTGAKEFNEKLQKVMEAHEAAEEAKKTSFRAGNADSGEVIENAENSGGTDGAEPKTPLEV